MLLDELLQIPEQAHVHLRKAVVQVRRVLSELLDAIRLAVPRVRPSPTPEGCAGAPAHRTGNDGGRKTGSERKRGTAAAGWMRTDREPNQGGRGRGRRGERENGNARKGRQR